jgi:hypothetical protein
LVFLQGELRMGRRWTDNDIAKLKSLAGKLPVKDIAAELGRSFGATTIEAHKLGLSLRRFRSAQPRHDVSASSEPSHPSNH